MTQILLESKGWVISSSEWNPASRNPILLFRGPLSLYLPLLVFLQVALALLWVKVCCLPLCSGAQSRPEHSASPWTVIRQAPRVYGISQARILEQVANPFSKGSSQSRDQTCVSCIGRRVLYLCKQMLQPLSHHITVAPMVSPEETQDAGPRWVRCMSKESFQWTQTLAPCHTQKSANFLHLSYLIFLN